MLGLLLALLISLYVLSNATENTTRFSSQYGWLILFNLSGLLILVGLISVSLFNLVRQYRAGGPEHLRLEGQSRGRRGVDDALQDHRGSGGGADR